MISYTIEEAALAQVTVRELEEEVKQGLKRRAARHGHSMEEEVRQILRNAVKDENRQVLKLGSRIAARFAQVGLKADLPELRNQAIRPPDFEV
ncbi:MAG: FitA-like ribbon-helix-helix domain-containing protein [Gammaproteobacteria bacterium]